MKQTERTNEQRSDHKMENTIYERTLQPGEDDRGAIRLWGFGDRVRTIRIVISAPDTDGITTVSRHCYLESGGAEINPRGMTIGRCPLDKRDAAIQQITTDLRAWGYTEVSA